MSSTPSMVGWRHAWPEQTASTACVAASSNAPTTAPSRQAIGEEATGPVWAHNLRTISEKSSSCFVIRAAIQSEKAPDHITARSKRGDDLMRGAIICNHMQS